MPGEVSTGSQGKLWQVADLIPHRHSMQLLDQILAADDQCLWASAHTTETSSSCWGIEYLGQATAAFFTLMQLTALRPGQADTPPTTAPAQGMLIGSRRYQAHQPQLQANSLLLMQVCPRSVFRGTTGLIKFQGSLWQLDGDAFGQLPLSTAARGLPYDTATLAGLNGQLLIEGDLSVYIPPQQPIADSS